MKGTGIIVFSGKRHTLTLDKAKCRVDGTMGFIFNLLAHSAANNGVVT